MDGKYLNSPSVASELDMTYEKLVGEIKKFRGLLLGQTMQMEIVKKKPFPRYLNQSEAIAYIGKKKIFDLLVQDYGLKPVMQSHKGTLYCSRHVEELCIQFEQSKWGWNIPPSV